jgi:hypothetical protein
MVPVVGHCDAEELKDFAHAEMAGADFGDERINRRASKIVSSFAARPQSSIPVASGDWAGAKGTYRFFSNPRVTPEKILKPHLDQAVERCASEDLVLAIGDTTVLDFTSRKSMSGLGPVCGPGPAGLGLLVHTTLLASGDGVPLGVADNLVWSRAEEEFGDRVQRCKTRPIEEKESNKWLRSLEVAQGVKSRVGRKTQVVAVFDREGDVYSVFHEARMELGLDLLIRAVHDRRIEEDADGRALWRHVETRELAQIGIRVPRGKGTESREALIQLCAAPVSIKTPPKRPKSEQRAGSIELCAVYAKEITPDRKGDRIEWKLLTTLSVETLEDACHILKLYSHRWLIEQFFRVLKTGCKVEERQFEKAERLANCLAADSIVAWMVLYLTILGRKTPDLPCTVVFQESEWKAVWVYIHKKRELPESAPTLVEFIGLVGRLGGHLARKRDGPPGAETLWKGLQRVPDLAGMWQLMAQ